MRERILPALLVFLAATVPGACVAPHVRPSQDHGDLFQVKNATGSTLALQKTGKGVFSEPDMVAGQGILVRPDALRRCIFSNGTSAWRYDFDSAPIDFRKFRSFGHQTDDLDPFLYFLEIRSDRRLYAESRGSKPAPDFPGFPLQPTEVDSPPLPAEEPRVILYVSPKERWVDRYFFMPSGRVVRDDFSEAQELRVDSNTTSTFVEALEACGLCDLQKRLTESVLRVPSMTVEVLPESRHCNADLVWDDWTGDESARVCLQAVRAAVAPLANQCQTCKFP